MVKKTTAVPALRLSPDNSVILTLFILCAHMIAMGVLFFVPLGLWVQLIVLCLVVVSMVHGIHTHILSSSRSAIRSAEWNSEGEWLLFTANGNEMAAQLKASSYVQPWFAVLNFSTGRFQRHSLILLPDAVDPELLRRLRVRLKLLGGTDTIV